MASDRIDHVAKAHEILRAVQELMDKPSDGYQDAQHVQNLALSTIAGAQVHATLALVEQQRIHNLIALADKFDQPQATDALLDRTPPSGGIGWVHHGLQGEIREALGLRE